MLSWTGGTIFGDFTNLGDLTISTNSVNVGNTLTNSGTIEVTSTLTLGNQYTGSAGAFLDNNAGGTITLEGGAGISGGSQTFNNQGTLDVTGGGTSTLNLGYFNNLDTPINVSAGTLVDQAGGTSTGATFIVGAGGVRDHWYVDVERRL